ncbi:hypothetical protein K2X05_03420 [bacterium]|nr:hypothetical protein [bacterium]
MKVVCFSCQKTTDVVERVGFRDECDCGADLHSCKCCSFYDAKVYNECRETSADVVREKERANYCDFFQPNGQSSAKSNRDHLLAAAEALFKKGGQ